MAGQLIFKLRVSDEQGLTGSEKVTINIFEDPLLLNLVEVIFTAHSTALKQQEVRYYFNLKNLSNKIFLA